MLVKDMTLTCVLVLIACLSLGLKIVHNGGSLLPDPARDIQALNSLMNARGYTLTAKQSLHREGVFISYHFQTQNCIGALIVTPLYRNAEGAELVRKVFGSPLSFIYQGYSYQDFPTVHFWAGWGLARGKQIFGLSPDANADVVLAIKETGICKWLA